MKIIDLLQKLRRDFSPSSTYQAEIIRAVYLKSKRALILFIEEEDPIEGAEKEDLLKMLSDSFSCKVSLEMTPKEKKADLKKINSKSKGPVLGTKEPSTENEEREDPYYLEPVRLAAPLDKKSEGKNDSLADKSAACPSVKPETKENGWSVGRFTGKEKDSLPIQEATFSQGNLCTEGFLAAPSYFVSKNGTTILSFFLYDREGNALSAKSFIKEKDANPEQMKEFLKLSYVQVKGKSQYDNYQKANVFFASAIREMPAPCSEDPAREKRIELAVHSKMTSMEGLISPEALKTRLKDWGHDVVGLTDYGSCQAFPKFYSILSKASIKVLYGLHARVLQDDHDILRNPFERDLGPLKGKYTVFDLETTGFSHFNESIIEIGAIRLENGKKVGEFSEFVHPNGSIPEKITHLTGITDAMVQGADPIEKVLPRFLDFAQGSIWVAHNAAFDLGFIREKAFELGLKVEPCSLDTLGLARALHPEFKNHKLDTITKELQVPLLHHHRAIDDATATAFAFERLMEEWEEKKISLEEINKTPSDFPLSRHESHDLLIYLKNQDSLKSFYQLVSEANMNYFYRTPGFPASHLKKYRDLFVIGTGFVGSRLFEAVSRRWPRKALLDLAREADFIAVEPPSFADKAIFEELAGDEGQFRNFTETLISLAEELNMPCCAVGMAEYLDPGERRARNILVNYERKKEFDLNGRYQLKTTGEMLEAFSFLPQALAHKLVIRGPQEVAEMIEPIVPIPQGTFTPKVEGSDEELKTLVWKSAKTRYGDPLPDIVQKRLDRELGSIISNGYSPLYVIAERLVKKSNADGYLVGSRGSVGSSLVATMAGITEVNPLPPHYVCPDCHYSEFVENPPTFSGFDLPQKTCPKCGAPLYRDGHSIPFEVFLGFDGDKEPDIDLNFAGEYMSDIHQYTEVLFGRGKVFRAGTISGVQTKTAYGYIKKYLEAPYALAEDLSINEGQIAFLQKTMEGVRRTTGQHAGGLIIVPQDMEISDFCPIQYPADDLSSAVVTTHFSYKDLSGHLLKLDELGHTSPTTLRQLEEMTGIDPLKIPFDDPETTGLFTSSKPLEAYYPYSNQEDGALGLPEFGTNFVRGMLKDTRPTTFAEFIRIAGLSHGTDVWLNNARDLIEKGTIQLTDAICTRDDIMTYLISMGMEKLDSFKTMEAVRKGRGLPDGMEEKMRACGVPDWYVESCRKIQYMFPRAHAVAYVMMSYRIAWFKVHRPAAFYATYYTQRLSDFSTSLLCKDLTQTQKNLEEVRAQGGKDNDNKIGLLEVIEEMYARDYSFAPVDLMKSEATSFIILDEKRVLPPLSALDYVSEANGLAIVEERKKGDFISRSDFQKRTGCNRSAMESLSQYGLLDSYPETNQLSFLKGF